MQSEMRFRALIENSWDGLTLVNDQGKILYSSPANDRINGYAREEREGRSALDLVHPDDQSMIAAQLAEVAHRPGAVELFEYRIRSKNGEWKWLESIAHNLLEEPGVRAIVVNFRDITARKQAEEQLRLQKALLESASEASLDGIAIISKERRWLHHNQRFIEMWGITPELAADGDSRQIVDLTYQTVADPESYRANIEYLYQNMDIAQQDELHFKDGRIFDRYTGPVWAADGTIYGRIWYCRDITERRQAELALEASESRWHAVFDNAGIGIALVAVNAGEQIIQTNPALQQMLGYTAAELSGLTFAEFTHPDDIRRDRTLYPELNEGRLDKYQIEKRYIRKDGRIFWANLTVTTLHDHRGRLPIGLGIVEDISQRKQAEEALRKNEARFRALIENSSDMVRILDRDGRTVYQSPSAERIMGYSAGQTIGKSIFDLIHPDDVEQVRSAWQATMSVPGSAAPGTIEARIRHADGTWHIHEAIGTNLLDNPDVEGVVMNSRDVSDRKRAEETLRESEERFRSLSQAAFEGIMIHEDGVIRDANQVFADLVGVRGPEELIGKNGIQVLPFTPESLETLRQRLSLDDAGPLEITVVRPDGSTYPAETQARGIVVKGRSLRVVAMRDITARKQAEQALQEARSFLQQVVDSSPSMIFVLNARGQFVFANRYIADYYETTPEALISRSTEQVHHRPGETDEFVSDDQRVVLTRQPIVKDELNTAPNGEQHWFHTVKVPLSRPDGSVDVLGIATDITDRKRAEEKIRRQVERLTALSEIDRAITSSFDLRLSLETLLNHLSRQLRVDAADVLLYDPGAQMLEYLEGLGFRTRMISNVPMQIGQGYAGNVIVTVVPEPTTERPGGQGQPP